MDKILLLIILVYASIVEGQTYFSKEYSDNNRIISSSIIQNEDSSYIVVGRIDSSNIVTSISVAFVKKIDNNGNLMWTKYYSFPDAFGLYFNKIIRSADSNFVIVGGIDYGFGVGPTLEDVFICKIDPMGNLLWFKRNYGGVGSDKAFDVIEHSNGDLSVYCAYGKEVNLSIYNSYQIIKTNSIDDSLWIKHYYNFDEVEQFPTKFNLTSDNGYILVGSCTNPNGRSNSLLIKTDLQGDTLWVRKMNTEIYSELVGVKANPGNISVFGNMDSSFNNFKPFIANYSNSGVLNWQHFLDVKNTSVFLVAQTNDGGFAWLCLVIDSTHLKNMVIKTDSTGEILWSKELRLNKDYFPSDIMITNDSGIVCTGNDLDQFTHALYLTKIRDYSSGNASIFSEIYSYPVSVFPSPVTDILHLEMNENIFNILDEIIFLNMNGQVQLIFSKQHIINQKVDISGMPSGVYAIIFNTNNKSQIKPQLIVKI